MVFFQLLQGLTEEVNNMKDTIKQQDALIQILSKNDDTFTENVGMLLLSLCSGLEYLSFFHNSRLIRWIRQNKIYKNSGT